MKLNFNDVLYAFSYGLDCVEHELVGVSTNHSKRVAYICISLGRALGLSDEELIDLAGCAVLHDCALTEYLRTEHHLESRNGEMWLGSHCSIGERNIAILPFFGDIKNAVLYHHENPDGSGVFGKKACETPLFAQLIHFADTLDTACDLGRNAMKKYDEICDYLEKNCGSLFLKEHVDIFVSTFSKGRLMLMEKSIKYLLKEELPERISNIRHEELYDIASFFALIIDYKSEFTGKHSLGLAEKAMKMAQSYGYDDETVDKLYFAGAVHDVGKLVVSTDILEKPLRLSDEEYRHIQTHAWYTYKILSQISGMEEITKWASLHHEKLDGTGYPFGKKADELDKNSRMLACLDIYQALIEPRPYKEGMPHAKVMEILRGMVSKNQLDSEIVEDIDRLFG